MMGIKEWNLDTLMHKFLWSPFKWIGHQFRFLGSPVAAIVVTLIGGGALLVAAYRPDGFFGQAGAVPILLVAMALIIIACCVPAVTMI